MIPMAHYPVGLQVLQIIAGALLLFMGRELFWLFVGLAGFLAGVHLAGFWLAGTPVLWVLLIALLAGVLGIFAGIFLQRAAFAIGGFWAGAYLAGTSRLMFGIHVEPIALILVCGIIGAVAAFVLMDWAIIALSCLLGAGAIVAASMLRGPLGPIVFLVLCVIGAAFQIRRMPEAQSRQG